MIICTITVTLSVPQTFAQQPQRAEDGSDLFVFRKDHRSGFMDAQGNIVIGNRFLSAQNFVNGYAVVILDIDDRGFDNWGIIDINGNVAYELGDVPGWVGNFNEGIGILRRANGFRFIDKEGNDPFEDHPMVIEPASSVSGFSDGFAVVRVGTRDGYFRVTFEPGQRFIDRYGNLADENFRAASSFSNGFARISIDDRLAIINTDFEIVFDDVDNEYWFPLVGISPCGHVVVMKENERIWGLINLYTGVLTSFGEHQILRPPSDGLIMARKDGLFGFVDMDNNVVVPFQYSWATDFYQGIARVATESNNYKFIDRYGNVLYEIYVRGRGFDLSMDAWDRELLLIPHEDFSLNRNFERVYPRWQSPPDRIAVVVNDWRVLFDVVPIIYENRTLVPFRGIFEALGMRVEWNEDARTAIGTRGNLVIEIPIDSNIAYVNGEPVKLEVPAMLHNDRTLIPIRFVAEASGAEVDWNEESRTVVISTN